MMTRNAESAAGMEPGAKERLGRIPYHWEMRPEQSARVMFELEQAYRDGAASRDAEIKQLRAELEAASKIIAAELRLRAQPAADAMEEARQIFGEWALRYTGTAATKAEKMVELIAAALTAREQAARKAALEEAASRDAEIERLRSLSLVGEVIKTWAEDHTKIPTNVLDATEHGLQATLRATLDELAHQRAQPAANATAICEDVASAAIENWRRNYPDDWMLSFQPSPVLRDLKCFITQAAFNAIQRYYPNVQPAADAMEVARQFCESCPELPSGSVRIIADLLELFSAAREQAARKAALEEAARWHEEQEKYAVRREMRYKSRGERKSEAYAISDKIMHHRAAAQMRALATQASPPET